MHSERQSEWHTIQGQGSVDDATPTEDPGATDDAATGADNSGRAPGAIAGLDEDSQHQSDAEASEGALGKQPGTGDAAGRKHQGDSTAPDTPATSLKQVCFKGLPPHR